MKVWRDFSLANLANRRNSPIGYFYIVHYWLYSKFAKLSQKAIRQTKVLPNFHILPKITSY